MIPEQQESKVKKPDDSSDRLRSIITLYLYKALYRSVLEIITFNVYEQITIKA
jgi:hypothetical protein